MRRSKFNAPVALALLVAVSLGCAGVRKPWRDYSELQWDSKTWLAGDAIERGRMIRDIFIKRVANGKRQNDVTALFGEPDLKKTIGGKEVWFYRIELGYAGGADLFPISFDPKSGGYVGMARGGTMSMVVESEEI